MATDLAKLVVSLEAQNTQMLAKLEQTEKRAAAWQRKVERSVGAVGAKFRGLLAGAVSFAGLNQAMTAISGAVDEMDNLFKASQKLGVSTEALSGLQYAAKLSDVSVGQLHAGMARLVKVQAEAARGSEKNTALFEALGIAFKNADGTLRDVESVFRDVASVMAGMEDGAEKTAVAMALFGKAGRDMIPLLNGGAEGIERMTEEARDLGLVVSQETAKAAEEFNDTLTRISSAAHGASMQVAEELLPAMQEMGDKILTLARDPAFTSGFATALEGIGRAGIAAAEGVAAVGRSAQWLGEKAAQFANGPAADSVADATRAVEAAELQLVEAIRQKTLGEAGQSVVDAAQAKLREAQAVLKLAQEFAGKPAGGGGLVLEEVPASAIPPKKPPNMRGFFEPPAELKQESAAYANALMQEADAMFAELEQSWKERDSIVFDLMDQEGQAIARLQAQYIELQNAVEKGAISQEQAASLSAQLAEQWATEAEDRRQQELDSLTAGLLSEEEEIVASYERRKQAILESTAATAEEKNALLARLETDHTEQLVELDRQRTNERLNMASYYTGALATLMQSGNSKLFAIGKAAAIAQATIDGYQAVQNALAEVPYPFNIAAAAAMAAATGVQIANIASTQFSGAYDAGGTIPAGKFGLVGERGPELVSGPATVTGRMDTAALLDTQRVDAGRAERSLRIVNAFDPGVIGDYLGSDAGERLILNTVRRNGRKVRTAIA